VAVWCGHEAEATSHGAVLGLALENLANFHGFPFPLGSFGVGRAVTEKTTMEATGGQIWMEEVNKRSTLIP